MLKNIFRVYIPIFIGIVVVCYLLFLVYDRSLIPAGQKWASANIKPGTTWDENVKEYLDKNPQPNAARNYIKAISLANGLQNEEVLEKRNFNVLNNSPETYRPVIAKYRDALNEIYHGGKILQCTLPAPLYDMSAPIPNFLRMQMLSKLVIMDGQAKESDKKYAEALNIYIAGIQFPRLINQSERSLIHGMVGMAQVQLTNPQLQRLIMSSALSEPDYQRIITAVQQTEHSISLSDNINNEYRRNYTSLNYVTSHIISYYKDFPISAGPNPTIYEKYVLKPLWMGYLFSYRGHILRDCYQTYITLIENLKNKSYPEMRKNNSQEIHPKTLLVRATAGYSEFVYIRAQETLCGLRLTRLQAAVQWYHTKNHKYPNSLEQLVPEYLKELQKDPFSDNSFKWNQSGVVPFAYSVGPDMKDDMAVSISNDRIMYDPTNGTISGGDIIPNGIK